LNTGSALLANDFTEGNLRGWTIMDEGSTNGPSEWLVSSGTLVQNSDIGSGSGYGTYVLY
jgi:hypothetical protein